MNKYKLNFFSTNALPTVLWAGFGPKVSYHSFLNGKRQLLVIEDLNPQTRTTWVMTRWELFCFSLALLTRALRR